MIYERLDGEKMGEPSWGSVEKICYIQWKFTEATTNARRHCERVETFERKCVVTPQRPSEISFDLRVSTAEKRRRNPLYAVGLAGEQ